jgi:hypothetical protein
LGEMAVNGYGNALHRMGACVPTLPFWGVACALQ